MLPIVFEMETSDPDDFMTLLWLADHPRVDLVGVLVTPGTTDQARLVRWALERCGKKLVQIGVRDDYDNPKDRVLFAEDPFATPHVSAFHYKVYGEECRRWGFGATVKGHELLSWLVNDHPELTVVTGAPPKILGAWHPDQKLKRWVMQGCFAGDNLVAPADRLPKFAGKTTCPSFNPGGAHKETLELLASDRIERRLFVSKNVCHGVVWTPAMQWDLEVLATTMRPGLETMIHGLNRYLEDKGRGKAMHDLVAAAVALDESVCSFTEVEIYRERGEWGAKAAAGTNTWISVALPKISDFVRVLAE
jgi:hypothetical protein